MVHLHVLAKRMYVMIPVWVVLSGFFARVRSLSKDAKDEKLLKILSVVLKEELREKFYSFRDLI